MKKIKNKSNKVVVKNATTLASDQEQKDTASKFLQKFMLAAADDVEKEENLTSTLNDTYRLPIPDLPQLSILLDGGLNSGWFSVSGDEGSSKSACALTCAKAASDAGVPIVYYIDAENAVKKKFACSIFNVEDTAMIFGKRDEKGNYLILPKVRYSYDCRLEKVFRTFRKCLMRLPDKQFNEATGKWYYVFGRSKEEKKKWEEMGLKNHDKKLYSITGSYWFEAPDDKLQFFGVIDSLPALVPTASQDDEESENKKIGYLAGPLSRHIPMVKGLLKRKHASVWIVNQLRDKISLMKSFGPSKSEPGGNAAKFYSDFRLQFTPVWPLDGFTKSKTHSEQCVEPSVEGSGQDIYMFKKMKVIKTKTSAVGAITYARMWVRDCFGKPRGYDPVFNVFQSLSSLGLIDGSRKREFKILLKGFEGISFTWETFKHCILIEKLKSKSMWQIFVKKYKPKYTKPLMIRRELSALIAKGNLDNFTVKKSSEINDAIDLSNDE